MMQKPINEKAVGQTTSKNVERSILLHQDNDILDLCLPITFVTNIGDGEGKTGQGCHSCKFEANHFDGFDMEQWLHEKYQDWFHI
jgi:hypothetical protein